jgi:replicative DNA helicase
MFENTNPFKESQDNPALDMALEYIDNDWLVFPVHYPTEFGCGCDMDCNSNGKTPATPNGFKDATTDENQIRRWFCNPNINIGIPTGKQTFYVLDIDVADGKQGEESLMRLEKEHGKLPDTMTAFTGGGGKHLCFLYSGDEELKNGTNIRPGIDFRGDGGYIVVEPSMHASGNIYEWESYEDMWHQYIEEMPEWLVELVSKKPKQSTKPKSQKEKSSTTTKSITIGYRNETLFKLGCTLREINGVDSSLLLGALSGANQSLEKPLDESEVQYMASKIIDRCQAGKNDKNNAPSCNLEKFLLDCYEEEFNRDPNSLLGHKLDKFAGIQQKLDGIQPGFYIMAAETNVGKTAFLSNLFFDLIKTNPDLCGVYFSMDDSKRDIRSKLISSSIKIPITGGKKRQRDPNDEKRKREMNDYLIDLYQQERMMLFDQGDLSYISQVKALAEQLAFQNKKFFFAVDGLFNLNIGNYEYKREENIERANELKRIADIYNIPMICSAEVRKSVQKNKSNYSKSEPNKISTSKPLTSKPSISRKLTLDDIMETAKYVYNANVVWLLSENDNSNPDEISLELRYAKNKLEKFKQCQTLIYQPEYGNVYEEQQLSIMRGI